MGFSRPTLTVIINRIQSDFETRISGIGTLLRRSVLKVMAKVYGGAIHILWGFLEYMSKQLFVSTAEGDYLDKIGAEYGLPRTAAVKATGNATVTGTTGTVVPAGTELQSDADQVYLVNAEVTLAAGSAIVALTAKTAGADGNDDVGITLEFVSPITDINTTATVGAGGLSGGTDEESDADYRSRVLLKKRTAPHGGAENDYVNWCLEVSGVTRVWTFPLYQGLGTIGVAFVRDDDTSIIPNEAQQTTVYNYLISHTDPGSGETVGIPVTAQPGLFMLDIAPLTVNFSIRISPNTAAVQSAVQQALEDLVIRDGGPGETLFLSRISEAISLATDEAYHELLAPTVDQTATSLQIHQMGTITFSTY